MNCRTKAMTISLLLHGAALSLVFALSSSLARQDNPTVIDFTVIEPNAPPAPPANNPPKKADAPAIVKPHPQPAAPRQKITPPAPAFEPEGQVAIVAKPQESLPSLPVQATSTMVASSNPAGGGAPGTAGKSRSAGLIHGDNAEQLSNRYRAENFAYIKKIIEENLAYPQRAQRMGWAGRVVVSFDVAQNGHVREIRIVKSTGYEVLDENLVQTIRKVEPFPRPPISVTLNIPFVYELR